MPDITRRAFRYAFRRALRVAGTGLTIAMLATVFVFLIVPA